MNIITSWELFLEKKKFSAKQKAAQAKFKAMIDGKKKGGDDEEKEEKKEDKKEEKKEKKD